ncbi:MAG: radical SAM family heme chaperone HemW [Alphaproteobacteria bacterium]|nr:radical SAM family heme chaperone HemW [Alphaproteobacteria bacterium]
MAGAPSQVAGDGHRATDPAADTLAIYVHWPFCVSKCPYCDFNSHVAEAIDQPAWRAAYLREIEDAARALAGRTVTSVFFGGGTPSLMAPDTAAAILEKLRSLWPDTAWETVEITLEANPNSAEAQRFAAFRAAGVNRLSLGVQALDDSALGFLGRAHSAAEALAALRTARAHFGRINADMIYARPGQSEAAWRDELARLMAEGLSHLSLYQLTIERGTPFFARHRRGEFALPGADAEARLYEVTGEVLGAAGLEAYEVSNYARPGAECRHNLTYWRYGDFAGFGPGAHGRLTGPDGTVATENIRNPRDWIAAVEARASGRKSDTPLTPDERAAEMLLMGLRLARGVDEARFEAVTGGTFADRIAPGRLKRLIDAGYLTYEDGRLRASEAGRLRLDAVIGALLPDARPD